MINGDIMALNSGSATLRCEQKLSCCECFYNARRCFLEFAAALLTRIRGKLGVIDEKEKRRQEQQEEGRRIHAVG